MTFKDMLHHQSRTYATFPISNPKLIKQQMLTWALPFNICCFLDNQDYPGLPADPAAFECLLAAGAIETFSTPAGDAFLAMKTWAMTHNEWLFGHLGYGLAAETEPTKRTIPARVEGNHALAETDPAAGGTDPIGFPDLFFFLPETVIELHRDHIRIGAIHHEPATIWEEIRQTEPRHTVSLSPVTFTPRITREKYLSTIRTLQQHILRGDCYEINFCQEFFARSAHPDPYSLWQALSKASPNPFSAYYRVDQSYLFCASPERYLKKTGSTLWSQPIKGTAPRYPDDAGADEESRRELFHSGKNRSENVMVVDLVRNDLARICQPGSVRVTELYGVYPFPQVFQMISTIEGTLAAGRHWVDALEATFPMGSMTGAPKNRVVQLILQYERSRRGLFSGALGYVTPNGDFDFNVVIRSLLYNANEGYLSYQVGSGITFYSDPHHEYEECLMKAAGILKAFT
jgi:para-aminobenzoate synthetase component 1